MAQSLLPECVCVELQLCSRTHSPLRNVQLSVEPPAQLSLALSQPGAAGGGAAGNRLTIALLHGGQSLPVLAQFACRDVPTPQMRVSAFVSYMEVRAKPETSAPQRRSGRRRPARRNCSSPCAAPRRPAAALALPRSLRRAGPAGPAGGAHALLPAAARHGAAAQASATLDTAVWAGVGRAREPAQVDGRHQDALRAARLHAGARARLPVRPCLCAAAARDMKRRAPRLTPRRLPRCPRAPPARRWRSGCASRPCR